MEERVVTVMASSQVLARLQVHRQDRITLKFRG
jgi:hypothetical protein